MASELSHCVGDVGDDLIDDEETVVKDDSDDSSDDDYEIPYYSDDESDTASLDHLSEGEDEIIDARMKKAAPTLKVNDPFLTELCDSYDRDKYVEKEVHSEDEQLNPEDEDIDGDNLPRHDPNTKWKHMHPVIGERYESPQQLKRCVIFYAIANGYKLWFKRNDYKRICVKCCKGASDEESCPFHLWASWMQKEKSFQIKTLVEEHRCSRSFDFGTLINCNWIASTYGKKIIRNPSIKLREIKEKMLKKYKCKVTKGQCERAKQKALSGLEICLNEHYAKLWSYGAAILESNPGSTVKLGVNPMPDGTNYFEKFYVCFKGLKDGWLEGCRRVIGLDGCFLKTICKGELLSAVGRDGNNQIYPIAWAVVNVENKENWKWFMQLFISDLNIVDGHGLTIISDQHKGIVEAAKEVMPLAEHRQCARHIYANFRKKFTGVHFRNLFWKASKTTYPAKFKQVMNELKGVSPAAYQHLMDRNPDSWSRAFLSTDKACDAVENGISECFNSLILEARGKPIINMLEDIRTCMMERMNTMRTRHGKWHDIVCPNIRKKFEHVKERHRFWQVISSGEMKFEVKHGSEGYMVDEINKTCSCRLWQLSGIPCEHATAAIYYLNINPDRYISDWYKKTTFIKAYNHYIYPVLGSDQWLETEYIPPLPPKARRMPGRPKKNRRKDAFESNGSSTRVGRHGRLMNCKNCYETGHNKRGCTNEKKDPPPKEVRPKGKQKPSGVKNVRNGMGNASASVQRDGGLKEMGTGVHLDSVTGDGMMEFTHEVPSPTWRNGINPSDLTIPPPMTQPIYSQVPVEVPLSGSQAPVTQPPVYEDDALFDVNVFGDIPVEVQPTNGELVDVLGDIPVTQIAANKKTKKLPIKRRCLGDRII